MIWCWFILICAIAVVEVSDFGLVPAIFGLQGIFTIVFFALEGSLVELLALEIFSIIFVPSALYYVTAKTKKTEELPLIIGWPSTGVLLILVAIL